MTNAQRLAVATAFMTLLLIAIGTFVRATGSGLGCPDWPTCHGQVVPPGEREALIEFSHRFVASIVGFMVIGLAWMAWRYYRHVPAIVWVAFITVPLVGFQGILGAITVVRELPPEVVATHLVTAMIVLGCVIFVAIGMYMEDPEHREKVQAAAQVLQAKTLGRLAVASLVLMVVLFWIGGYMAESGAATACSGWPLCNGGALPANDHQEITHMLHRYLAGAFIVLIVPFVLVAWRARHELFWAGPLAIATGVLYVAQVLVGALNVWYTFPEPLTVAHTAVAASVWFALSAAAVFAYYAPAAERRRQESPSRIEVPA